MRKPCRPIAPRLRRSPESFIMYKWGAVCMDGLPAKRSILTGLLPPLVIVISLVIALGSFISYWVVENAFTAQLTASERQVLIAANEHMAYLFKDIENLSDKIYINRTVRQILSAQPETLSEALRDLQGSDELSLSYIDSFFTESQLLYRWMKYDVYILGFNGYRRRYSSASNAQTNILMDEVARTDWYDRVLALGGQPMVVDGAQSGLAHLDGRILYTRLLKDIPTDRPIGLFILSFSKQTLNYIYRTLLGDEGARLGLVSADGASVWGSRLDGLLGELPRDGAAQRQGAYLVQSDGGRFQMLYDRVEGTGWYLVKALDLGRMLSFTGRLKWFVLALVALCSALVSLFSAQTARKLYRPIDALLGAMRSVRDGRYETGLLDVARDDEIGVLNRGFSEMAQELQASVERLIAEQNGKRRAELQALQAQIKPHFLYNTLTSIRCVIRQGDGETAQRMIIALVKLLKNSLNSGEEFFTVAQELDILRSYALIYQTPLREF